MKHGRGHTLGGGGLDEALAAAAVLVVWEVLVLAPGGSKPGQLPGQDKKLLVLTNSAEHGQVLSYTFRPQHRCMVATMSCGRPHQGVTTWPHSFQEPMVLQQRSLHHKGEGLRMLWLP